MNIEGAWKRGYTGKNIVVTILDDGIERTHPDLMQNYVSVYCVTIQKFDPYINIDPGTLNPYEHGECYVTADGMVKP